MEAARRVTAAFDSNVTELEQLISDAETAQQAMVEHDNTAAMSLNDDRHKQFWEFGKILSPETAQQTIGGHREQFWEFSPSETAQQTIVNQDNQTDSSSDGHIKQWWEFSPPETAQQTIVDQDNQTASSPGSFSARLEGSF